MPIRMPLLAVLLCCAAAAPAAQPAPRGMAFEVYIRLEHGMTEGELVRRAGKPDRRAADRADQSLKTYHYLPTRAYPFLTTVTLRAGRIVHIERVRRKPQ